ncbi:hypothetical protein, partial [Herbaspirillum sp. B65]|uniref:hypothetical protein n=1 Tax=Herbaspirillum sp. B65 TaxID=137708 RepID=UPI00067947A7
MGTKKILSVGVYFASDDIEERNFDDKISLLDWDIIIFRPLIAEYFKYADTFQGKHSLTSSRSFALREQCEHWRRELTDAFDAGRMIVVFLPPLQEVYVDTGQRTRSGTGRNEKVTTHVSLYSNYECLPLNLKPVLTRGRGMKLSPKGAELLAPYWNEFEQYSFYEVVISPQSGKSPSILTKAGDKAVGTFLRNDKGGAFFCLPNLDFTSDDFFDEDGDYSDVARQFSVKLAGAIVALDKVVKSDGDASPEPDWAQIPEYESNLEISIRTSLLELESKLEEIQREKEVLRKQLKESARLRNLLFEKGKPLENAIIDALALLGFEAAAYKDSESEFDVVFESSEGRMIGEAEGKDSKAINVDKLRQLAMNVTEDLARDSVDLPAKGVLFGNGYRLLAPENRPDQFTDKCKNAAAASSTALIATSDLFKVAQYLAGNQDVILLKHVALRLS